MSILCLIIESDVKRGYSIGTVRKVGRRKLYEEIDVKKKLISAAVLAFATSTVLSSPVQSDPLQADALETGALKSGAPLAPQDVLEKAIACAVENKDLAASFTLDFTRHGASVSHRYDARSEEWTFLSGKLNSLKKDGRKSFEEVSQTMGRKGGLVPKDISDTVESLTFLEETDEAFVYIFEPSAAEGEDPMPSAMVEALDRRFLVDKETLCMSGLSMVSAKGFKPSAIVKIDTFEFAYDFKRPDGSPIPLIAGFQSAATGSALFKAFDDETRVIISDVEIVEG